jgi:ABC-type uncharacterized transport system permease subunit
MIGQHLYPGGLFFYFRLRLRRGLRFRFRFTLALAAFWRREESTWHCMVWHAGQINRQTDRQTCT